MSLLEFKTLIDHKVCSINNSPLGIYRDMIQPITPNNLIMGEIFPLVTHLFCASVNTNKTITIHCGLDGAQRYCPICLFLVPIGT